MEAGTQSTKRDATRLGSRIFYFKRVFVRAGRAGRNLFESGDLLVRHFAGYRSARSGWKSGRQAQRKRPPATAQLIEPLFVSSGRGVNRQTTSRTLSFITS